MNKRKLFQFRISLTINHASSKKSWPRDTYSFVYVKKFAVVHLVLISFHARSKTRHFTCNSLLLRQ